jgi:hypothetical protein
LLSTVLIVPKSPEWQLDPTEKKWKLKPNNDTYTTLENAVRQYAKSVVQECKSFLHNRSTDEPRLVNELKGNSKDFDWDKAVGQLDWPNADELILRTKFTSRENTVTQIRAYGAGSGCYIGNNMLLTCGHGLEELSKNSDHYVAIFGWNRDVTGTFFDKWAHANIEG